MHELGARRRAYGTRMAQRTRASSGLPISSLPVESLCVIITIPLEVAIKSAFRLVAECKNQTRTPRPEERFRDANAKNT